MSAIPVAEDMLGPDIKTIPLPEVARALGQSANKVRQLLREGQLIAVRREGELYVPEEFLDGDAIVKGLPGTMTVLSDAGFGPTEMLRWLFEPDETLPGSTPINALRTNHGKEVKRRAQAMAF